MIKNLEKGFVALAKMLRAAKKCGDVTGYALIGGFAVSARAKPRATKDIDFLIRANENFYTDILPQAVAKMRYTMKVCKGDALDPLHGMVRIFDAENRELADLIPIFWKWQDDAIREAEEIEIFASSVPVAKTEDLVILKLNAGGPQDLLDVEELLKATPKAQLDMERMQALAKRARVDKKLARFFKR